MSKMGNLFIRAQECPHIRHKRAGDEYYDLCEINDKYCLLESELKCPYYEEIKEEDARNN